MLEGYSGLASCCCPLAGNCPASCYVLSRASVVTSVEQPDLLHYTKYRVGAGVRACSGIIQLFGGVFTRGATMGEAGVGRTPLSRIGVVTSERGHANR
jgi:hypothetical protein